MPNQRAADHIATQLREGLTHPGDGKPFVLPMPMFRTTGMPAEQLEHYAKQAGLPHGDMAKLAGEAIVHTLENDGKTIIDDGELNALRARADAQPPVGQQMIRLRCNVCHNPLFRLSVADVNNPTVNGPHLFEQLAKINPACPHGPVDR